MRLFPIILLEWSLSLFSGLTNIWKTGWVLLPLQLHANLKSYTDLANNRSIKYGNNSVKTYSFSRHKSGEIIFTSYSLRQGSTSETMWDQTTRSHCEKFSCKKYTTFQKKKKKHTQLFHIRSRPVLGASCTSRGRALYQGCFFLFQLSPLQRAASALAEESSRASQYSGEGAEQWSPRRAAPRLPPARSASSSTKTTRDARWRSAFHQARGTTWIV